MSPECRAESLPVFEHLLGKYKRVEEFDEFGQAWLRFKIRKGSSRRLPFSRDRAILAEAAPGRQVVIVHGPPPKQSLAADGAIQCFSSGIVPSA